MRNGVALVGYSGHGYVVGEAAIKQGYPLIYYTDKREVLNNPFDLTYLGDEADARFIGWENGIEFILGIGDNLIRKRVVGTISTRGGRIRNVIHPNAYLSDYCEIGHGNFLANGSIINTNVEVGNYSIINTACIIEHDCVIGHFCHVAPGAILAGSVKVGDMSFIGANSIVKEGVKIGEKVVVGAGAVVLRDISDGQTVVGNPARFI